MTTKTKLTLGLAATLALSACVSPTAPPANGNSRMANGALIGGMAGAFLGSTSKDDRLKNAAVAGAFGAAIGAAIGATLDQQAQDLRNSIGNSNISVTNTGEYLIVNMPQDVLFATGSAALRPDLAADLQAVARNLIDYPASRIEVIGHTDNVGSAAMNQDLSQRRAGSVASVLIGNGVPAGRIAAFGRGEDMPVASNLTESGRAQNRRVEILIRPTQ